MILKNAKGQALVETALALFLLMLLVFGIVEFGRVMYTWNTLNNAARAGARQAAVTPNIFNDNSVYLNSIPNDANKNIYDAVNNTLVIGFSTADKALVNVSISGASSPVAKNDIITIQVVFSGNYTITRFIPITNTLTGRAAMRYEL